MKRLGRPRCDDGYRLAGFLVGLYDFVIYIRNVSHIGYMVFAKNLAQKTGQNVKDYDRSSIADVGIVIDRRAAYIKADILWI